MITPRYCRSLDLRMLLWLVLTLTVSEAFYLPGLAPVNFCKKTEVSTTCKVCLSECVEPCRVYYHQIAHYHCPLLHCSDISYATSICRNGTNDKNLMSVSIMVLCVFRYMYPGIYVWVCVYTTYFYNVSFAYLAGMLTSIVTVDVSISRTFLSSCT